jgi:hypothetical protein
VPSLFLLLMTSVGDSHLGHVIVFS